MSPSPRMADVTVIGAGVVGTAIARELATYDLRVALVEAGPDVGIGTSKANTAIWHTGFDAPPGSLESKLLRRAYPRMAEYAEEVGIPIERTGAILVAWTEVELAELPAIAAKALKNGVTDVVPLSAADVYAHEPNLGPGALGGLRIAGESIICPYTPPLAFATEAVRNGTDLLLGSPLTRVTRGKNFTTLTCGAHEVRTAWTINAAGLESDTIDFLFGHARFKIVPRRGELIVFDKLARGLLSHVLLPVPTKTTKGVLVSPTVFGNVLLGPTAEDLDDRTNTDTTRNGVNGLLEKGRAILPRLLREEVTATYAGLRAACVLCGPRSAGDVPSKSDYQIHLDVEQRYVCVGGIRSTGLSASLGIAEHVAGMLGEAGVSLRKKAHFERVRMPPIGESQTRAHQDAALIRANPDHGRIVCHCERVTRGELVDAIHAPVPATTLDGLRRRTRCLQGRCQGFYCFASVAATLAEERDVPLGSILPGEDP